MATPEAIAAHLKRAREQTRRCPTKRMLELYASRRPVTELPGNDLYNYANKHNLIECSANLPQLISPVSLIVATEHLSQEVEYELEFGWPFGATADCGIILGLYSNYTIDEKKLIKEDEEDVIEMVKEALELDKSVRPKWYFDVHDEWQPGDSDDESD